MRMKYVCRNNNCSYPGATQFEMTFKLESIMDTQNIAATFCTFCRKEMASSFFMEMAYDSNTSEGDNCIPS